MRFVVQRVSEAAVTIDGKTVGQIRPAFLSGSLIYKARTDLALLAVHEKADFVLWIDSDMVFAPDLMIDLMADMEGRDMVAGICHMRRPPFTPVLYSKLRAGITPADVINELASRHVIDKKVKQEKMT